MCIRDRRGPRRVERKLHTRENHGNGRGNADFDKGFPVGSAVDPGHADEYGVGEAYAGVGIDDAGHKGRQKDDERLGGRADAQPQDGDGNPGDGRNGTDGVEKRAGGHVHGRIPAHEQTQGCLLYTSARSCPGF